MSTAPRTSGWPLELVRWYQESRRDLPWRQTTDPYRILVSEVMLQQTRIETVKPYYERFISDYPTVEALARAPEEEVLKHWEGLGYYSRARNLQKAARAIVSSKTSTGKGFPDTFEEIRRLPGVGEYTAGAIASIAFGMKKAAVDGNVLRVMARLTGSSENVLDPSVRKSVGKQLEQAFPAGEKPGDFIQGLMELGELVCTPKTPLCLGCPLAGECVAFREGRQSELPVREHKSTRREEHLLVLILRKEPSGELVLFKRPGRELLGGLYELPNIPLSGGLPGETAVQKAEQAFFEKYGLPVAIGKKKGTKRHAFTHVTWIMEVYEGSTHDEKAPGISEQELTRSVMLPTAFRKALG